MSSSSVIHCSWCQDLLSYTVLGVKLFCHTLFLVSCSSVIHCSWCQALLSYTVLGVKIIIPVVSCTYMRGINYWLNILKNTGRLNTFEIMPICIATTKTTVPSLFASHLLMWFGKSRVFVIYDHFLYEF